MDYEKEQERLLRLFEDVPSEEEYDDEEETGEEDNIEERSEDSDTEQEFDENESERINESGPYFMGRDKKTKWSKHCPPKNVRTRKENLTLHLPGGESSIREETPAKIWECFFDNEILNNIVNFTNIKIEQQKENFSRSRDICPTNLDEIKALIGLLYLAGVRKANHLNTEDLWKTDGSGIEIFRLTMNLRRFRTLLRFIRFDDIGTRQERVALDKLAPIRNLFDDFNENLKKCYHHSNYVTVDEKLEAFRGRCKFRQYMPKKPTRYGIKIFALSDAKTFYTSRMEVYVGKQPDGPYKIDTSAKAVVERLCEHILKTNRTVTTDNWFSSIPLAQSLMANGLTFIGTMRKNKRELPDLFTQMNGRPIGSSMFGFGCGGSLVSYVPKKKRNVLLFSTQHKGDDINEITGKPEIIHKYNETKGGVDVVDKLCAQYNTARATRRWPMVIFYSTLNVAGINAFVIYNSKKPHSKTTRREFLIQLSSSLLYPHQKNRAMLSNLPKTIKLRLREICNLGTEEAQNLPLPGVIGRCSYCGWKKNRKTKYSCKHCGKFMCLEHIISICSECCENTN